MFNNLFHNEKKPGQQIQKFNRLIVEGIQKNNREIICYSAVTVSKQLLNDTILKLKNDALYHYGILTIDDSDEVIIGDDNSNDQTEKINELIYCFTDLQY